MQVQTLFNIEENQETFKLESRRYIGSKAKLSEWIMYLLLKEVKEKKSFADIFAGTGIITKSALKHFQTIIINDFLFSNNVIYKGFFENAKWNKQKLNSIISNFNAIKTHTLPNNYFSENFGGKYFHKKTAKKIGYIREQIETLKSELTDKEYNILLASLLYSIDRVANTVGHYDAYFKREIAYQKLEIKLIQPIPTDKVLIFKEDANELVRKIKVDVAYLDPPYNSRQYSRFYHLLETLVKWDKPKLYGVALKPKPENISEYCKVSANSVFDDLINNIDAKYIVVSYNNTYNPKSNSSKNKITLQQIENILKKKGSTKIFENTHKFFNAGNTSFDNHKELLFITKVDE